MIEQTKKKRLFRCTARPCPSTIDAGDSRHARLFFRSDYNNLRPAQMDRVAPCEFKTWLPWCGTTCMRQYAKCQQDAMAALQEEARASMAALQKESRSNTKNLRTEMEQASVFKVSRDLCTPNECPIMANPNLRVAIRDLFSHDRREVGSLQRQVLELKHDTHMVAREAHALQNDLQNLQR
jgi:hypothetical protein